MSSATSGTIKATVTKLGGTAAFGCKGQKQSKRPGRVKVMNIKPTKR